MDGVVVFSCERKGEVLGSRGKMRNPVRAEMVRVLRDAVGRAVKVAQSLPDEDRKKDTKAFHAPLPLERLFIWLRLRYVKRLKTMRHLRMNSTM